MPPIALPPSARRAVLALIAACVAILCAPTTPANAGTFPVIESFEGSSAPGWTLGGTAALTAPAADPAGSGWLRLTPAQTSKSGYAFYDVPFPSSEGVLVDFDYATYGGTGADGITFFLYDGTTSASQFQIGAFGGELGYTSCNTTPGLKNAYVGVGLDEFGNFTNLAGIGCGLDGSTLHPNSVTVRGSQANKYAMLASTAVPNGIQGTRANRRHVTIGLTPGGKLTVSITFPDGSTQTAVSALQLPAPPSTLKLGYAAATGGSTNIHEIRSTESRKPTDLAATLTDGQAAATSRTAPITWNAVITNKGPNATSSESVVATNGAQSLTGITWACTAAAGASCGATTSGTGLPSVTAGAMPINGTLSYAITGTPAAGTDRAELTIVTKPEGDTGDLAPADNTATDRTDLTPEFDLAPTVASDPNTGTATVTAAAVRGGTISSGFSWLRCDASGASCSVIQGESGLTYAPRAADRGLMLRVRQTATNAAGTASRDSAAFASVPTTALTTAPSGSRSDAEATFVFSSPSGGTTFECSYDSGAYVPCTSPATYLAEQDGDHAFAVRAVRSGLRDPSPQTAAWNLDTVTPSTTVTTTLPAATASRTLTLAFSGDDGVGGSGVAGFECQLDDEAPQACSSPWTRVGLADGDHVARVRAVDAAGNPDPAGVELSWLVDATAPATNLGARPPASAPTGDATFTFTGNDGAGTGVAGFECRLDDGVWDDCSSPASYPSLPDGIHTFEVRAVDDLGNRAANGAWYGWTVDTAANQPQPTTPAATTPQSTTPVATTPQGTTPQGTTPAATTPQSTTPRGTTPAATTPQDTTPSATTPQSTTPEETTPEPTTPAPTTPSSATTPAPTTTTPAPTTTTPAPTTTTPAPTTTTPAPPTTTPRATTPAATTPSATTPRTTTPAATTPSATTPRTTTPAATTPPRTTTTPPPATSPPPGGSTATVTVTDPNAPAAGSEPTGTQTQVPPPGPAGAAMPPAPSIASGPSTNSTDPTANFTFEPATGATVRCAVDGAAAVDCTDGLNLTDLADGAHIVIATQTDALGRSSAPTAFRWEVRATALRLTAAFLKKGKVAKGKVAVMCKLSGSSIKVCAVQLYARSGKRVIVIASGKKAVKKPGVRSVGVKLKFNKKGLALLARSKKTLKVSLRARSQPYTGAAKLKFTAKAKVRPAKAARKGA